MKKLSVLLGFCLLVAMLPTFMPQPVAAMTGSGTSGDPYVIYNVTDLQNMNNNKAAYYKLANDIDASATSGWNGGAGFVPVGTVAAPFTGHFNGNNYTIDGLYINRGSTTHCGMFGYVTEATIGNVTLSDFYVKGQGAVGGLIGYIYQDTTVTYIRVYGECLATANGVGGCIGQISDTHTLGYSYVTYCYAYATVTSTPNTADAGCFIGIAGYGAVISSCASDGQSYGHVDTGGFVGSGGGGMTNCYSRAHVYMRDNGTIGGGQYGGGFGGAVGPVVNCYSTGMVTCLDVHGCADLGGFTGNALSGCTACFWDLDTSLATSDCGTGKSTPEMKTQSTFTDAGWDFDTIWSIGGTINDGYPYLLWWYNPPDIIQDANQVVWFQPNAIIEGTELPNRAQGGTLQDGEFHWGANPAGITISHGELIPEEEYDFVPISPGSEDIIKPDPDIMTADVDTAGLVNNPLYPLVHALGSQTGLTDRLVWLILAWLIVIGAMLFVHIGFDTKKGTEKPQHFVLTTIVGLGLSILFYTMGIFPLWVVILMAFGLIGAIIYERQPVL